MNFPLVEQNGEQVEQVVVSASTPGFTGLEKQDEPVIIIQGGFILVCFTGKIGGLFQVLCGFVYDTGLLVMVSQQTQVGGQSCL